MRRLLLSKSEETVLSDDIDIEAVNGGFPMSDVIEIQVTDAIYISMLVIKIWEKMDIRAGYQTALAPNIRSLTSQQRSFSAVGARYASLPKTHTVR